MRRRSSKYQDYFKKKLEEHGIKSPADIKDEAEKKKFFEDVDKDWDAKDEADGKTSKVWAKVDHLLFSRFEKKKILGSKKTARNDMLDAYLEAALWSSTDDNGDPMDRNYDISDIDKKSIKNSDRDLDKFVDKAGDLLDEMDSEQIGHDFWLTRNGHGAGFWDRSLGDVGDKLTKIADKFGEVNLYVGDDGKVYID